VFSDKEQLLLAVLEREADARLTLPETFGVGDSLEAFIVETLDVFVARFERLSAITIALGPLAVRGSEMQVVRLERLYDDLAARFAAHTDRLRVGAISAAELLVTLAFTVSADWPGH